MASDSEDYAVGGAGADSENDDVMASLPPALTVADMIRHYSDEGKRMLLESMGSPPVRSTAPAAPAPRAKPVSIADLEIELDDVKSVFGEKSVGNVSNRPDGSVEFQLRLRLHGYCPRTRCFCWVWCDTLVQICAVQGFSECKLQHPTWLPLNRAHNRVVIAAI